jgi:hypothetical protein
MRTSITHKYENEYVPSIAFLKFETKTLEKMITISLYVEHTAQILPHWLAASVKCCLKGQIDNVHDLYEFSFF